MTLTTITKMILLMGALRGPPDYVGVHFAPLDDFDVQFEDGEFITSLTPALQSGVGSVALNAFAHAAGLEVGSFFDASAPHISANTREYQGESPALTVPKIPPALVGNAAGKVARFRRVPGSTESPNGLAPVSRYSPRSFASVSPPYLDNTHAK